MVYVLYIVDRARPLKIVVYSKFTLVRPQFFCSVSPVILSRWFRPLLLMNHFQILNHSGYSIRQLKRKNIFKTFLATLKYHFLQMKIIFNKKYFARRVYVRFPNHSSSKIT